MGGCGAVGTLFADALAASGVSTLTLIDNRLPTVVSPGRTVLQDDARRPSRRTLERVSACDWLLLAVPEPVAIDALPALLPAMTRGALLVDTLSVKSRYARTLAAHATEVELLGVNPMFAPGLGFAGRSVIAVPYHCADRAERFLDFIAAQGSDVVRLDAEAHDRACAALQAATHASVLAFGLALNAAGYDLATMERVMPPPHRTLLALLARIIGADPEVYRDIQVANPFAAAARADLLEAHRRLESIIVSDDPDELDRKSVV
jgi:prephenate dehydrogenase